MKIQFSIIVPTYKSKYLNRAIRSVQSQTYENWEMIIVDNSLKNNEQKYLNNYKDHRISYYTIQNSGVIGKSRNFGIKKAKYNWICFLDSDDYWLPEKLTESIKIIKKKKYDLIYHNMRIEKKKNYLIKKKLVNYNLNRLKNKFDDLILNGNNIIQSSVLIKKKILQKVNYLSEEKKLIAWEDFDLWLRISKISNNFFLIDKILGGYHVSDNENEKLDRYVRNIKTFLKKYEKDINKIKIKYKIKKLWWVEYTLALKLQKEKKYKKAYIKLKEIEKQNINIKLRTLYLKFKMIFLK